MRKIFTRGLAKVFLCASLPLFGAAAYQIPELCASGKALQQQRDRIKNLPICSASKSELYRDLELTDTYKENLRLNYRATFTGMGGFLSLILGLAPLTKPKYEEYDWWDQ